ncbi:MAG: TatD family hydrolase [Chloroflexi bacterium]|nr:TatD family hydrolase [Chloroflexota bacterium]
MIDAHAHLTDGKISADTDAVLQRAATAGVERILTCGEDVASSEAAIALAARYPSVRAAVGIHPHRASTCDDATLARLRELARRPGVVGIGEIGIDLSGRSAALAIQERAFAAQVGLAAELDLPVSIHVRDAGPSLRALLDGLPRARGHVHCFSEGPAEVAEWVRRGLSISFAGTVTYPKSDALRAAAAAVPLDRLLVETDAPYLAPQAHRGRLNEPALIAETYACIASVRGLTVPEVVGAVRSNAVALWGPRW